MTTNEKVARRKLSILELAKDMQNVSKACQVMGYSRQQFYEIRRNYQTFGAEGLMDKLPGPRGPHPNRVSEEIEEAILAHSLEYPTHGPVRVAQELALKGIQVSSGGVRGVWSRHDLPYCGANILIALSSIGRAGRLNGQIIDSKFAETHAPSLHYQNI